MEKLDRKWESIAMKEKNVDKRIILGSGSPRRRELLEQIGIEFEIRTSDKEEIYESTNPEKIVKELAQMKAGNVALDLEEKEGSIAETIIIGADTVVAVDDEILGKPESEEDAFRMLKGLSGRAHQVYTGVALLVYGVDGEQKEICHAEKTEVFVHSMTDEEIQTYIASGEPMDKAGSYGIQGKFAAYIDRIEGDYYNVVGLPISYVYQKLKEENYSVLL